ncbi:amidase family protein [Pyrenochaeta sp. DS3sAY3a]|nr:amidase family protein [Pyrenochaeta sp. DS3sAY3a]
MAFNPLTATASHVQAKLTDGTTTSEALIQIYLGQIARHNDYLKAVIATAPEQVLIKRARELDHERAHGTIRGPLHGIPILVKDNINTSPDLGLPTTCGSLALTIWSAVGGQTQSAYVRGGFRANDSNNGHSNPGGSSSGSAHAVAAGFSPISIGTETMGSLMIPSDRAALYTMKPTLKLVSQAGIVPITHEADSAGPMTKSVEDLANLLDVLVDPTQTTIPEGGYRSAVTGDWGNVRIGVLEPEKWLLPEKILKYEKEAYEQQIREWQNAVEKLKTHVKVVKNVRLISPDEAIDSGERDVWKAFGKPYYLDGLDDSNIHTLEDLIEFNKQNSHEELGKGANHNQDGLIKALNANLSEAAYDELIAYARDACGRRGIDKALEENEVDILMGPGDGLLFSIFGAAGYPGATLPLGYLDFNGRPFGFQIVAKAHQEALLIQVQSAWEATFPKRRPPPLDEINPESK